MKSVLLSVAPEETQMAVVEDGELSEICLERAEDAQIVGNIYKGRVQNVLPGMQAAFVDIGMEKNAFLYIGDGLPKHALEAVQEGAVHTGQFLLVQIVKAATAMKGPRATTHLTLPGRYVVLTPTAEYIGISRRIPDAAERERLRGIAEAARPAGLGLIVRTAAAGKSEAVLRQDIRYLANLWRLLLSRSRVSNGPTLLYRDADLVIRIARDYLDESFEALVVDQKDAYRRICDLLAYTSPDLVQRVRLYEGARPLFQKYALEDELAKLGKRLVELQSGGSIVIDRTEALTVVDVNTGRFVGRTSLADTALQTNLEAAREIMRQLRLRDIGGIIIVDFIDMETQAQKECVLKALEQLAKQDRVKTHVVGMTTLGLVEITRKKSRRNFESTVYSECPYCAGRGFVASPRTVSIRIGRDLRRLVKRRQAAGGYLVQLHAQVAEEMRQSKLASALEKELGCRIVLESVPGMHPEVYSILQA